MVHNIYLSLIIIDLVKSDIVLIFTQQWNMNLESTIFQQCSHDFIYHFLRKLITRIIHYSDDIWSDGFDTRRQMRLNIHSTVLSPYRRYVTLLFCYLHYITDIMYSSLFSIVTNSWRIKWCCVKLLNVELFWKYPCENSNFDNIYH